jgi:hypothetical protein
MTGNRVSRKQLSLIDHRQNHKFQIVQKKRGERDGRTTNEQ